jgi:hypothetical protein
MAAVMNLHLQRAHFGIAAVGSKLSFRIAPAPGFTVTALLDCDSKVVASWAWEELKDGRVAEEMLIPKGTYNLILSVVFTSESAATAEMTFGLGATQKRRSMTGEDPDIGKAIAVVFIK